MRAEGFQKLGFPFSKWSVKSNWHPQSLGFRMRFPVNRRPPVGPGRRWIKLLT